MKNIPAIMLTGYLGFGSWKKMGGVITGVNVVWVQVGMRGSGLSGNWCQLGTTCVFYVVFSENVNFAASVSGNDVCAS